METTLIDIINTIIGFEYSQNPYPWLCCFFLIIYFVYQMFTFLYCITGANK